MFEAIQSKERGMAMFVVLLVLCLVSLSFIATALQNTTGLVDTLTYQAQLQNLALQTKNKLITSLNTHVFLNSNTFEDEAFGEYLLQTQISEWLKDIDGKPVTFSELSVKSTRLSDGITFKEERVIVKKQKRIEILPSVKFTLWSPDELLSLTNSYFKMSVAEFKEQRDNAHFTDTDCSKISSKSLGYLLINGNCELSNLLLGNLERPITLIVEGGHLFTDNIVLYGAIFHLCAPEENFPAHIDNISSVRGTFISTCSSPIGKENIHYSEETLNNLIKHDDNIGWSIVEGSWLSL